MNMKNFERVLLLTATVGTVSLIGCATLENYEFGDATAKALEVGGKVIKLKRDYCSAQNEDTREMLLGAIRLADPDYDGLCGDQKN